MSNKSVGMSKSQANSVVFGNKEKTNNVVGENKTNLSQKTLVLMWSLIILGYFLFVVQWYSIGNFSSGYSANIGNIKNPALNAMPNWTITLMRGIGSVMAGWLIVKIGHRYAVITVLSLMVLSFPFIIVAALPGSNQSIPDGSGGSYDPTRFGLFLFFRLFLAIGGTTLITYTNSVIANMPTNERPKFMTINQFGFNGGAFFANIFFVFGLGTWINETVAWIVILSFFVILIAIALVLYIIFGKEVVPVKRNLAKNINEVTFGSVIKESFTWKLSAMFIIWLVAVVFINSGTMRNVIEQSPQNFRDLVKWNILNKEFLGGDIKTSMASSTLSTPNFLRPFTGYNWVWPLYICLFVSGFFVGLIFITPFAKTIFKRKKFMILMFALGFTFTALSILTGYFGGYGNPAALTFFLIFIFIAGIFLWSVNPIMLSLYQQVPQSNPKYVGIISGLVWGIGYIGYTFVEIILSISLSYAKPFNFGEGIERGVKKGQINWSSSDWAKEVETPGGIIVLVGFAIICLLVFVPIVLLPDAGIKDENGEFKPFTKEWKITMWNFKSSDVVIK